VICALTEDAFFGSAYAGKTTISIGEYSLARVSWEDIRIFALAYHILAVIVMADIMIIKWLI
jgi:hypothetical protein